LPRSFQDVEVFGSSTAADGKLTRGSVYMTRQKVEVRAERGQPSEIPLAALPPEKSDPISFMVDAMKNNKPIEGITALDINVGVVEIIEAAKESIRTGRSIKLR
jgi:predicted dehydrogenase